VDIYGTFDTLFSFAEKIGLKQIVKYEPRWGEKPAKLQLNDPLNLAIIDHKYRISKIFIHNLSRPGWEFFAFRNLLMKDYQDTRNSWHLATIFALLLLPANILPAKENSKIFNEWKATLQPNEKTGGGSVYRLYTILGNFDKEKISKTIVDFLNESNDPDDLSTKRIHHFLIKQSFKILSKDDINAINLFLANKKMDTEIIIQNFGGSQAKAYRTINRLRNYVDSFIFPNWQLLGIIRIRWNIPEPKKIDKLTKNIYYEGIERFSHARNRFVKIWYPVSELKMLEQFIWKNDTECWIEFPVGIYNKMSPNQYNGEWMSIQKTTNSYWINYEVKGDKSHLDKEELELLRAILSQRTISLTTLKSEYNIKKRKEILESLTLKKSFDEVIVWKKPIDIPTGYFILTLKTFSKDADLVDIFTEYNEIEKLKVLENEIEWYKKFEKQSWPYFRKTYCINITKNEISIVCFLKITAIYEDIVELIHRYNELEFIGVQEGLDGTVFVIPVDVYRNGKWGECEILLKEVQEFLNY
jgi:hypothetical protein